MVEAEEEEEEDDSFPLDDGGFGRFLGDFVGDDGEDGVAADELGGVCVGVSGDIGCDDVDAVDAVAVVEDVDDDAVVDGVYIYTVVCC